MFKTIAQSLLHFLFPPVCVSCQGLINTNHQTLCKRCFESLKLIDANERCHRCFRPLASHTRCPGRSENVYLSGLAACFDESVVTKALLSVPPESIASFMLLQWHTLNWPYPDLIIPTPGDRFSKYWSLRQGLGSALAKLLNRPYHPLLTLHRHLLLSPHLCLESHPAPIPPNSIDFRNPATVVNKHILLIHDIYTTGHALNLSAHALLAYGALSVRGISLILSSDAVQ